jgi:predicted transcriptional regulator of viral defense system
VIARRQLVELGMSRAAIQHRVERGRLHPLWWGVYAIGRPNVGERGRWMAAVLSCGPAALLSHHSAAALWGLRLTQAPLIDVVVPAGVARRRRDGIVVHRRVGLAAAHRRLVERIPVTDPVSTLLDLASCLSRELLERAVNEADRLDLIRPDELREAIEPLRGRPGTVGFGQCSIATPSG